MILIFSYFSSVDKRKGGREEGKFGVRKLDEIGHCINVIFIFSVSFFEFESVRIGPGILSYCIFCHKSFVHCLYAASKYHTQDEPPINILTDISSFNLIEKKVSV